MRSSACLIAAVCLILTAAPALAQSDRGTITGTVSDPAGAVIGSAPIEAKNVNTGAIYKADSTTTGNYSIVQLPAGSYQLSAVLPGFKHYIRTGITVLVAQTLRIDITLEVGNITETVTVNADAPLLKTESGELSHNVTSETLGSLPILGFSSSIRDPYATTQLIPGALYQERTYVRINGAPANTQGFRIEGQDSNNSMRMTQTAQTQPSVDAVEEFAVQTSNYAAEYGQAGGGFFNVTMKSGTNSLHGSAYDYWINEALNASTPFTGIKNRQRRNNYGFTLGGPVKIPGLYDGHDKTFFFFNWEQFREGVTYSSNYFTVPTLKMREGDFSEILTNRKLNTDPLGRNIMEYTIYDPKTDRSAPNGQRVRDQFSYQGVLNRIDPARFDPVAVKIQNLIPKPTNTNLTNNYLVPWPSTNYRTIPSVKLDHNFGPRTKISGYWSMTRVTALDQTPFCDGIRSPVTGCRNTFGRAQMFRLNFDQTLTPTTVLHFGMGLHTLQWNDDGTYPDFDQVKELGLSGASATFFPYITFPTSQPRGGMKNMGPLMQSHELMVKPTANSSFTWAKSNHTYKFGAEMRLEGYPTQVYNPAYGTYAFTATETALAISGLSLGGGSIGFPYASFLLGAVNNGNIGVVSRPRMGKQAWALFAQDSWKITRKFTLDYGLRWDYQGYFKDTYGRIANFSPTTANPSAGGLPGAVIFEGSGAGHCNCNFAKVYPFAFGPRLGAAYQIAPKTVFRAGVGIMYGQTATENRMSTSIGSNTLFSAPSYGDPIINLKDGPPTPNPWPNLDPGQYPLKGQLTTPPNAFDHNAGRPPRTIQWSISLQREFFRNFALEVSYVGNRGAWWEGNELLNVNALTADMLKKRGLDLYSTADQNLLKTPLKSVTDSRFAGWVPYSGFPTGSTLAQALRPFPQFGTINYLWAPLGRTWYDSLQIKATKRFSNGLDFTSSFTYQKELMMGSEVSNALTFVAAAINDVFDRKQNKYISRLSRPYVFVTAVNYTFPKLNVYKPLSWAIRDWRIGAVLQYASGMPIKVPTANSNLSTLLFRDTFANRVAGQPLFLKTSKAGGVTTTSAVNLNDRSSYNPYTDFVLNPAAWADPGQGQFSYSPGYYDDYRYRRRPSEAMSIGRVFRLREGVNVSIRADFQNIFNRLVIPDPTATNAGTTQNWNTSTGQTQSGFGYIATTGTGTSPRSGIIVVRLQF
jgi:hypothetical protein